MSLTAVTELLLAVKTLIVSPCFPELLKPTYNVLESVSTPNQSFLYFWPLLRTGFEFIVISVPQFVFSFSVLKAFLLLLPCWLIVWYVALSLSTAAYSIIFSMLNQIPLISPSNVIDLTVFLPEFSVAITK